MSSTQQLRDRVAQIGKEAAILEEMIRLGFVTQEDITAGKLNVEQIKSVIAELGPTLKDISQISEQIKSLDDIKQQLAAIRTERIAAVKARREERKAQKAEERARKQEAWELAKRSEAPFLGVGVSARLTFSGGDESRLVANGLPHLESLKDLAVAMKMTTEDLVWLAYERGASDVDHYSRFEIPKRSGGSRLISSPKPKMRKAQSWINEEILAKVEPSKHCFAFRPGLSIVHNATSHLNKELILKLDIKDFFPSISFKRVRGYFEFLGFNPGISTVLALICTDSPRSKVTVNGRSSIVATGERGLPQGACTSPALANLIASRLDSRLAGLIRSFEGDWVYTRYADDLTFSTNNSDAAIGQVLAAVTRIAADETFTIKQSKTRIMRAPRRQSVTGLIVGNQIRIPKESIKRMRALFNNIEKLGQDAVSEQLGKNALNVAQGYWAYLFMVSPELATKYASKHAWLSPKK
jgi:retron-type reverse transcriptase